jgi:hypothetical protein
MKQPDKRATFLLLRAPLLVLVIVMLLAGGWAALQRAGWQLPMLRPTLVGMHGPLMLGGLFGTLISLERAVAVTAFSRQRWVYLAPALSACGGLLLIAVGSHLSARLLLLAGSVGLVVIYGYTSAVRRYWSLHTLILGAGAIMWAWGNVLWVAGQPLYVVIHSWIAFLVLTIVGERLELSRVRRLTPLVERLLVVSLLLYMGGALFSVVSLEIAMRIAGSGQVLIGLWLLRFDVAGRSVRQTGLTRYIAVCLLVGYVWLALGGILAIVFGTVYGGFQYDAVLHAVLVGFVFSMVFGHAPLIIPALTDRPLAFRPVFYAPLVLLHVSLLLREYSNLTLNFAGRQWAGMINAVAVILFMGLIVYHVVFNSSVADQQKA